MFIIIFHIVSRIEQFSDFLQLSKTEFLGLFEICLHILIVDQWVLPDIHLWYLIMIDGESVHVHQWALDLLLATFGSRRANIFFESTTTCFLLQVQFFLPHVWFFNFLGGVVDYFEFVIFFLNDLAQITQITIVS